MMLHLWRSCPFIVVVVVVLLFLVAACGALVRPY